MKSFLILIILITSSFIFSQEIKIGHEGNSVIKLAIISYNQYKYYKYFGYDDDDYVSYKITGVEVRDILRASKEGKFISYENAINRNLSYNEKIEESSESNYYLTTQDIVKEYYNSDMSNSNIFFMDYNVNLNEFLDINNFEPILDENYNVVGYLSLDDNEKYICPENMKLYIFNPEDGDLMEFNIKKSSIAIPDIINFNNLVSSILMKLCLIVSVILSGYICFLVVKRGLRWSKNYLGITQIENNSKLAEEFKSKCPIFVNKAQSWRNNKFSESMPFVKKDEYGGWYDSIHDEHYQETGFSEEYYLNMRRGTLYLKYINMYSQFWDDYNNGLDVYSEEKKTLFANEKIRQLSEDEFYQVLKIQNVNLATVMDEDYLADIILTETDSLIQPVEENKNIPNGSTSINQKKVESGSSRRFVKSKRYSRRQFYAIRNYYKKRRNSNSITQPVVQPSPVPQQETVKLDDGFVSQEENRRLQMEWYEKNKAWIDARQSPVKPENRSVAELIAERQKLKEELSEDSSPYFHSPISEP